MKHFLQKGKNIFFAAATSRRVAKTLLLTGSAATAAYIYLNMTYQSQRSIFGLAQADNYGKKLYDPYERSRAKLQLEKADDAVILTGPSNPGLASSVAEHLGLDPKHKTVEVKRFADGESSVKVLENVNGRNVYIVQPTCPPSVNDSLMELILMISACKRGGATSVTVIVPYYGYARQDRKFQGYTMPISGADVAQVLESMGVNRIVSVDLHVSQAQGYVSSKTVFDNLEGAFAGLSYFLAEIPDKKDIVVVSPDAGGLNRAKAFHKHFAFHGHQGVGLALLNKERKEANKIEKMELVGNVQGKVCIIVDDMIDTAGTLCEAARVLKEDGGAKQVYAFASHGLFSGPAAERIRDSSLTQVITTDSIPVSDAFRDIVGSKYRQVSIGMLLAETIRRVHQRETLDTLYTVPIY